MKKISKRWENNLKRADRKDRQMLGKKVNEI